MRYLWTSSVDVDPRDIVGDKLRCLDRELGVGGADLEDEFLLGFLRCGVRTENDALLAAPAVGRLHEVDAPSELVLDALGADDGLVDNFWACKTSANRSSLRRGRHLLHTASAPYFKLSSLVGSSPVLTIGASTHLPTNPGLVGSSIVYGAFAIVARSRLACVVVVMLKMRRTLVVKTLCMSAGSGEQECHRPTVRS